MKYLLLLLLSSCMIKDGKYIQDNPVEEIAESILKQETGLDLDFTPSSPEPRTPPYPLIQYKF